MADDYPDWVCSSCGAKYGNRRCGEWCSTWHIGTCGICGRESPVTEPRDFGHLYPRLHGGASRDRDLNAQNRREHQK